MDREKVAQVRRGKQRGALSAVRRAPWGDQGQIRGEIGYYWVQAVCLHPDLRREVDAAREWLRTPEGYPDVLVAAMHTHARDWLRGRYPRIWGHPPYLNARLVYDALDAVLAGVDWAEAGVHLADQIARHIQDLKYPVHAEVWVAERTAPGEGAVEVWPVDDVRRLDLHRDAHLCADDAPLEINRKEMVFVLTAHKGWTRAHIDAALDRICLKLEQQEGQGYSTSGKRGPQTSWRHLPALYRLWREHPTTTPERPDLWQGKRPITWEEFAGTTLNATTGNPDLLDWVKAFPEHWEPGVLGKNGTSDDTVKRAAEDAIMWLAPEPGTAPTPADHPLR